MVHSKTQTDRRLPSPREIADLVLWEQILQEVGANSGRRGRTSCILHGGNNPTCFAYNERTGRSHCFACDWSGDKIEFFRAALGCDFRTVLARLAALAGISFDGCRPPSRQELIRAKARRTALNAARDAYYSWGLQLLIELTDQYRLLSTEQEIAAIAYRSTHRRPDLYTAGEQFFWTHRLAFLYNRLVVLEHDLDVLTYRSQEAERFSWWRQEDGRGQLAA